MKQVFPPVSWCPLAWEWESREPTLVPGAQSGEHKASDPVLSPLPWGWPGPEDPGNLWVPAQQPGISPLRTMCAAGVLLGDGVLSLLPPGPQSPPGACAHPLPNALPSVSAHVGVSTARERFWLTGRVASQSGCPPSVPPANRSVHHGAASESGHPLLWRPSEPRGSCRGDLKHGEDTCPGPGHLEGEVAPWSGRGGAFPRRSLTWRGHLPGHPRGHPRDTCRSLLRPS